jgi:AraC-like DNA-binding protein
MVEAALAGDDDRTEKLRRAIFDADFERAVTNAELARRSGVSRRHFQRRRAEAVASIARYAGGLLGSCRESCLPLHDASWRFRREVAAFLAARDRGNALEMRCIANNLVRLAEDADGTRLARSLLDDANRRLGITEAAFAPFDQRSPQPRSSRSWNRLAKEVGYARQLVVEDRIARAETVATSAWQRSELRGFQGLAARSAAVLYATAEARGEFAQARSWRARAIESLLGTQDRLLGAGLFLYRAYDERRRMDRALGDALYNRLCLIVPQMLGDGERQRVAVTGLIAAIFDGRVSRSAIAPVAQSDSAFAHYAEKSLEPVAEMLALALTALTGRSRDAAFDQLRAALADCASKLRPAAPRTIAIAVPSSQSASIDHLKFDDQRSGRVEDLAGLHVRFLPFRSDTRVAHARRRGDPVAGPPGAVAGPAHSR